jgi:glycosyltransferase involved in cell wall biosynthesis
LEEMPMKVLMAPPGFHPIRGGTETVVRNLSVELNRIGVHTDVMTFNMDRKYAPKWKRKIEKIDGVTVFKIPALKWLPIEPSPRINLRINLIPGRFTNLLNEYDIIHFHEVDFSFPLFSFFVKKPKILHLHGISVGYFKRYHLSRIIFKRVADYYITITKQMARDLTELGITTNRIIYLPNSINVNSFHPEGEKDGNLLLYVGRIVPVKGLHVLLESLRYLRQSTRLVIVGPIGDFKYYQEILEHIERENEKGKHKITYLGTVPEAELMKIYQKASIFILPSFWEAFPVVILEALSCETPVITTPVGENPEVIRNFENGILVPVNDPLRLAEAINFMLDNKDNRTKMGRKGRELVIKKFSVEVIAKRLRKIYQEMISQ